MRYDTIDPKMVRLWKKRLLVGGALVLGLGIAGCGAGAYGVYALGKHISTRVDVGTIGAALPTVNDISLGPVTGTVLAVVSDWAAASIASGDVNSVKQGLACVDALGGPDAGVILDTLASKATNASAADAMRRVSSELAKGGESRPASCITFLAG